MKRNKEGVWILSKIDIHGSKLCGFLSRVLENYPRVGIGHSRATIYMYPTVPGRQHPNFIGLFHRKERYIKLSEEEIDPQTAEQAKLLLQTLKLLWRPLQSAVEESRVSGLTEWAYLWTIYQPGDITISREDTDEISAARIVEIELISDGLSIYYHLTVEVVVWNGSYTGYKQVVYEIRMYDGFKKLTGIKIYPLSYNPDPEKVKERLVQRGRTFEILRGCFFMTRKHFNVTRVSNSCHVCNLSCLLTDKWRWRYRELSSITTHITDSASTVFLCMRDWVTDRRLMNAVHILRTMSTLL